MLARSLVRALGPSSSRNLVLARRAYVTPPPNMDEGELGIFAKLSDKFSPTDLQVMDVSGGCGTFYAISITSDAFKGLSTVKQHRLVNDTLKKEISTIHGLQLKTSAPAS